ncbi:hypothetical protein ACXWTF_10385 [Thiomicrolovo sp. ZZH C-3]
MQRSILTKIVAAVILLIFSVTQAEAEGVCGATAANSFTFNETNTTGSWSGAVDYNSTTDYYFQIDYPGTLTIEISSPASKVNLAYSNGVSCPTPGTSPSFNTTFEFQSDPQTLPFVLNLTAYADSNNETLYTISATFTPSPIGLSKSNYPMQILNGADTEVTYSLTAYNYSNVQGLLTLEDTLPAELNVSTIQPISTPPGWNCTYPTAPSNTFTCTMYGSDVAQNGTTLTFAATLQPDVAVNQTPYPITNTATLYDPDSGYVANAASTVEAVDNGNSVDLEIQKYAEADMIPADTDFKYAIFVLNHGNKDAYMINVTDSFPNGQVDVVSYDTTRGWTCPTLPPTGTATNPASFNCTYDSTLSSNDIAVLVINARTKDLTVVANGDNVYNVAEVDAINPLEDEPDHPHVDDANFTIGYNSSAVVGGIYPENGIVDASDVSLNSMGSHRSLAYLHTRVASEPNQVENVYFFDNNLTAPYDTNVEGKAVPLTVIFRLGHEDSNGRCVLTDDDRLTYDGSQVVAIFDETNNQSPRTSNAFQMRNQAIKKARLIMKYIDINKLLDLKDEDCAQSNMSSNLAGIPQCFNSGGSTKLDNNKYITVFGADAYVRCILGNGNPCDSNNHGRSCGGIVNGCPGYNDEYDHDFGCYECTLGGSGSCARDPFAIRPKAFDVNISNGDVFRAGSENSWAFKALTANPTLTSEATLDYNETNNPMYDTSFIVDLNFTKKPICNDVNLTPYVQFQDGVDLGDFAFDNVVTDATFSIHEDHENNATAYASIDANDTAETESMLFIEDFSLSNITIIPHHFNVDGNLSDYDEANAFTYMFDMNLYDGDAASNEYNLSTASLDVKIKAVGKYDKVTTNYIDECFADPDVNVTLKIKGTKVVPANALTKFLYHYYARDNNNSVAEWDGNTTLTQNATITELHIENNAALHPVFIKDAEPDGNGTVFIQYKLNFDRKINKAANPMRLSLKSVDVNNTKTDPDYNVFGQDVTTDTATFLYGRAHSPRYRVDCNTTNTGPCTSSPLELFFEFYSTDSNLTLRKEYAQDNQRSKDAIRWFRNTHHSLSSDGNITGLSHKYFLYYLDGTSGPLKQIGSISTPAAGISSVTLGYTGSDGYPYKGSVELHTQKWLNYDRFNPNPDVNSSFLIEFNAIGQETGDGTLADPGDGPANSNRRIRW